MVSINPLAECYMSSVHLSSYWTIISNVMYFTTLFTLALSSPIALPYEIKRHLLLGRKVMTNLDSILKSRDITLPTNIHLVKAMVFPVVMYGCESWTVKKAEHQRIDAFELWCWRSLLRVPWTARRSNQSFLKEISPEYSLKGLKLKTEAPIFWPPDAKSWFIWKDTDARKDWEQEEKGTTEDGMVGWHHQLNGHGFGWTLGVGDGHGNLACAVHGVRKSRTWLSDWTELNCSFPSDSDTQPVWGTNSKLSVFIISH